MFQHYELQNQHLVHSILHHIFPKMGKHYNIPNHYRQQPPANVNLHYHSGTCVIDLEPLSRGQHPLTIYYEPHTFLQTPRVRTMVTGAVFWDHMTYNPHWLPPIKALSIADMLGADEIFVFLGHQMVYPICGQYSFRFITTLLDGKFPNLHTADYQQWVQASGDYKQGYPW